MLLEIGRGSSAAAAKRDPEKELYFRSFPRPDSGAGPATVSSHSLWRKPMMAAVDTRWSKVVWWTVEINLIRIIKKELVQNKQSRRYNNGEFFIEERKREREKVMDKVGLASMALRKKISMASPASLAFLQIFN